VQEVFLALPAAMRGFRGEVPLGGFLRGLTINVVRHQRRSAARRLRLLASAAWARLSDDGDRRPPSPIGSDLAVALAALAALPWDQRVAFVLCELEELSAREAAAAVGAPEATIRTRLFHARKKLREHLEEIDP
jgi:RNA polymerase sigma-70 factor (ECF subfamily)